MSAIAHLLDGREKYITETEKVLQPLPNREFRFASPFVLLHHAGPDTVSPGSDNRIHPHPHRGFAPVSFIVSGEFHHRDTMGNDQILAPGDVQWMFAGKGVLHSEGPSPSMHREGGVAEMVQLWINVPASEKWNEPQYQYAEVDSMPDVFVGDGVHIRLVSGSIDGRTGPVTINHTPITSLIGTMKSDSQITVPVERHYWNLVYCIKGSCTIDGEAVSVHQLAIMDTNVDELQIRATSDCMLLVLSGQRLDEPVAAKDNFVMSTMEEADQAIQDYHDGKFGTLDY